MQQQEKVVLGVSLVVTLMAGWVQVGEASAAPTAERRQQACYQIQKSLTSCPSDPRSECASIAASYGCNGQNVSSGSCEPVWDNYSVLTCNFSV